MQNEACVKLRNQHLWQHNRTRCEAFF